MSSPLPKRIPLFPLPGTVLFPEIPLPLHIFEPRYREMMADALAGDKVIGMVLLKPGFEADYEGRPPVFAVGCVGSVVNSERLPDGRYNLLLHGQKKFRILSESAEKLYRIAEVEYLEEDSASTTETALLRRQVLKTLQQMTATPEGRRTALQPPEGITDYELVNFLSHIVEISPLEKQALLEEPGTAARMAKLDDILQFWRLGKTRGIGSVQ